MIFTADSHRQQTISSREREKHGSSSLEGLKTSVCIGFLERFYKYLKAQDVELTLEMVVNELMLMCEHTKGKEHRLCYYVGATSDAATKIVNEIARPMSAHVPVLKICEKLKRKDMQICELKYAKKLKLNKVELSRLRVAELKRILDDWGEKCIACVEKVELINLILELARKDHIDELDVNCEP
ncbi:cerebral dopamine neurotrophic factor isoform X2 [Scyliorhinus canicula]|uniref:cerebral dopamine neurotrophic factor isoform X2 n=1 Tax=Scyliorhinus canicula TaxID=7830 RepID=UPI0018F779D2|nr:cerebral dopamine neurotrophic factor isoform X2 [Scyliorhinus canicula]